MLIALVGQEEISNVLSVRTGDIGHKVECSDGALCTVKLSSIHEACQEKHSLMIGELPLDPPLTDRGYEVT